MQKNILKKLIGKTVEESEKLSKKIEESNVKDITKELVKETKSNILNVLDSKVSLLKSGITELKKKEKKQDKKKEKTTKIDIDNLKSNNTYYEEELVYKNSKKQNNDDNNNDKVKSEINEVVSTSDYKVELDISKQIELNKMRELANIKKNFRKEERHKKWRASKIRTIAIILIIASFYIASFYIASKIPTNILNNKETATATTIGDASIIKIDSETLNIVNETETKVEDLAEQESETRRPPRFYKNNEYYKRFTGVTTILNDDSAIDWTEFETIKFGRYDLDGNLNNGLEDIEWYVLDVNENEVTLFSKYILCLYRDKEVFFNKAFNEEEQKIIGYR